MEPALAEDVKFPEGLETAAVDALLLYENNARTHSAEQIEQIAVSIREFGFNNPVLIDSENGVVAGHGRLMAARKMGLGTIPVVRLGHLTPAQRRAYVLADNQIALNSGWDFDLLAKELDAVGQSDIDLDILGFSEAQLDNLLNEAEGHGDFLDDLTQGAGKSGAGEDTGDADGDKGGDLADPDAPKTIDLKLTMLPGERDSVVAFLNAERERRGTPTIAAALREMAEDGGY